MSGLNEGEKERLARVCIGQTVFNANGQEIDCIIRVRRIDNKLDSEAGVTPAEEREWLDLVAKFAAPDDKRAFELTKPIWSVGYAKMRGPGSAWLDQFILPQEIARVDDDGVHLNTSVRQPI